MQIQTLKDLIKTRAYRDRPTGGYLDAETVTTAIYDEPLHDRYDQMNAFTDSEQVRIYDLATWMCTDTQVGLKLVEIGNEPMAVTWQSARKCTQTMTFISPETRAQFIRRWDQYAVRKKVNLNVLDDVQLSMPIAPLGEKMYEMDGGDYPYLEAAGAARILDDMKSGNVEVKDPDLLRTLDAALRERIAYNIRAIDNMRKMIENPTPHLSDEKRDEIVAEAEAFMQNHLDQNTQIETEMLPMIADSVSALTSSPQP